MQKNSLKSYKVITINVFEKQAKRLIRKYPSLRKEIDALIDKLVADPFLGDPLGNDCYKIRLAIQREKESLEADVLLQTSLFQMKKCSY